MSTRRIQEFVVTIETDMDQDPFTEGNIQNAVQQFSHRERGYRPDVQVEDT